MTIDTRKLTDIAENSADERFTESFKTPENLEERKTRGLGMTISHYCGWNGQKIMEIFEAALEDANFHTEAAQVSEMIEKEKAK